MYAVDVLAFTGGGCLLWRLRYDKFPFYAFLYIHVIPVTLVKIVMYLYMYMYMY